MAEAIPTIDQHRVLECNITYMRTLLDQAAFAALKAEVAIYAGSDNEAIDWLLDLDKSIKSANALLHATVFIHKQS